MANVAHLLILAATMAAGCELSTLQVKLAFPDADDEILVHEAGDVLGFDIVIVPEHRGSIKLTVARLCDVRFAGLASDRQGGDCYREALADDDAETIAHEIGHALGLRHVPTPAGTHPFERNLMSDLGHGHRLTDEQRDTLAEEVAWMATWCR